MTIEHRLNLCPCCSGLDYQACCGPIIAGAPAATAEALMRSRYSAFATRQLDYIELTQSSEISAKFGRTDIARMADECEWTGLQIVGGSERGDAAEVEFVARFRQDNREMLHAERSQFRREHGRWLYVGGRAELREAQRSAVKVGRNDPCPCGSGKKAKKCCGTEPRPL